MYLYKKNDKANATEYEDLLNLGKGPMGRSQDYSCNLLPSLEFYQCNVPARSREKTV